MCINILKGCIYSFSQVFFFFVDVFCFWLFGRIHPSICMAYGDIIVCHQSNKKKTFIHCGARTKATNVVEKSPLISRWSECDVINVMNYSILFTHESPTHIIHTYILCIIVIVVDMKGIVKKAENFNKRKREILWLPSSAIVRLPNYIIIFSN